MQKWLSQSSLVKAAEDTLQERHQLMALVKEAEAHATHALYSLPARYATNRAATDATNTARQTLKAKLEECARQIQQYDVSRPSSFYTLKCKLLFLLLNYPRFRRV